MSLSSLYQSMIVAAKVESQPALSLGTQEKIYEYCMRSKDWSLLAEFARYEHLEKTVEDRIRELDKLEVLVAWATRPGRTADELVERLRNEKRVNALLPLAALPGLPAKVYETLAKIKSTNLGEALAGNTSVPLKIRQAKLRDFVSKNPRSSWGQHEARIHALCAAPDKARDGMSPDEHRRELYQTVAETTDVVPYIQACVNRPYVRTEDISRWTANLGRIYSGGDRQWSHSVGKLILSMGSLRMSQQQRQDLIKAGQDVIARDSGGRYGGYYLSSIQDAVNKLLNYDEEIDDRIGALESETDPAKSQELATSLLAYCKDEDRVKLLRVVSVHKHLPLTVGLNIIDGIRQHGDIDAFMERLESERAYQLLYDLVTSEGDYYPWFVRHVKDEATFFKGYVKHLRSKQLLLPNWMVGSSLLLENVDLAFEGLRWSRLANLVSMRPEIAGMLDARLQTALADDQVLWETFHALAEGFEGTLEELLAAVKDLNA